MFRAWLETVRLKKYLQKLGSPTKEALRIQAGLLGRDETGGIVLYNHRDLYHGGCHDYTQPESVCPNCQYSKTNMEIKKDIKPLTVRKLILRRARNE